MFLEALRHGFFFFRSCTYTPPFFTSLLFFSGDDILDRVKENVGDSDGRLNAYIKCSEMNSQTKAYGTAVDVLNIICSNGNSAEPSINQVPL